MEQFVAFLNALPAIEKTLREKGEKVPRPKFDDAEDEGGDDEEDSEEEAGGKESDKKNFEATSDEDD